MTLKTSIKKDRKYVHIDLSSEKSIRKSEDKTNRLVNRGYNLKKTIPHGFDNYIEIYEK